MKKTNLKKIFSVVTCAVMALSTMITALPNDTYAANDNTLKINIKWNDSESTDVNHPDKIDIPLTLGDETVDTLSINKDNCQHDEEKDIYTFNTKALDEYNTTAEPKDYNIGTPRAEGYTSTINRTADDVFDITLSPASARTVYKVNIKWDDNNNKEGVRPDSVKASLLKGKNTVEKITIEKNKEGSFIGTFKEVETADDYTVKLDAIDDYTINTAQFDTKTNTFTITCTLNENITPSTETIDITTSKTWDDANDQDGMRPTKSVIRLLKNGKQVQNEAVLTADNKWSYTWKGLEAGTDITYTIEETNIPSGYINTINGFNITSKHIPATKDITVSKYWADKNNADGIRPDTITVRLYANGKQVKSAAVTSSENWTHTFSSAPVYQEGKEITYTISEDAVNGYTATYNGFAITNTHTVDTVKDITEENEEITAEEISDDKSDDKNTTTEKVSVTIKKVWEDNNDSDKIRPNAITVHLKANGAEIGSTRITRNDSWQYTYKNLEKYDKNGKEIVYTVTEDEVKGYKTTIRGFTITNAHTPEKGTTTDDKTKEENKKDDDTKTGDASNIWLYAALMFGAAIGVVVTVSEKKKIVRK